MEVHMVVVRSSDSRRTAVLHTRKSWRNSDRQAAQGDELPASPRSDTALHDRANSFQAAREGGREEGRGGEREREHRGREKGGQGNVNGRKQDPNILTSCVRARPRAISQTRKLKPPDTEVPLTFE